MRPDVSTKIASSWIQKFGNALQTADLEKTLSYIHPGGYFRDVLVFSWNNRCLHRHQKIEQYLKGALKTSSIANVELDFQPGLQPEYAPFTEHLPLCAVSAGFKFTCSAGLGRGSFSLVLTDTWEWKALIVMMALVDIKGHEEVRDELALSVQERRKAETDPHVLIIGAGQSGLNIAARFKQMNISMLVVEDNYRVGDNWRKRYPSVVLHSPKKMNSMLYQPYPSNFPVFIPRDEIADWLEQYASAQDLVVWTNSRPLPLPTYDEALKRWTVVIDRGGEHVTLHPVHIIVAAGVLGAPRMPSVGDRELFLGSVLHSSEYKGGKSFAGQRVVVVGAGNTAADICQDLCSHGARAVTMVQRSETWVASRASARALIDQMYPEDVDIDVCDLMTMGRPLALQRKLERKTGVQMMKQEEQTHRGLREAGFKISSRCNFLIHFYEGHGGLDVGCAELIRTGKVKIKQGAQVDRFSTDSVVLTDGSSLEADAVLFATSYENICDTLRPVFGDSTMDRVGPVWGLDAEGELRGCYRPTGHPGLWFAVGDFSQSRISSKQLALQIKAIELGLLE
ncbi:FAD/NAD-P-binding domain-containing protein, partial [Roridomyces roridus]